MLKPVCSSTQNNRFEQFTTEISKKIVSLK